MTMIEGTILQLRRTNDGETPGIELRVFIPEPRKPSGCIDPVFYETENEFEEAKDQREIATAEYNRDVMNINSLCLEEISIHPHRELPSEVKGK